VFRPGAGRAAGPWTRALDRGPERRPSLAYDMPGLEDEFRSRHGYPLTRPTRRRREVLEGEREQEIPP
jgi:hypothetical protein